MPINSHALNQMILPTCSLTFSLYGRALELLASIKTMPLRSFSFSSFCLLNIQIAFNLSMTPQWNPPTLEEVKNEDIDRVFQPFSPEQELQVPCNDSNRLVVIH